MVYDSVYEANNYLRSGVESESETSSQTSTNSNRSIKGTSRQRMAQQFNTGHVLVGGNPTKVTWYMYKEGSPTGNVTAHIRTSAGVEREQSTTLLDSSSLGLVGGGGVAKEFTFTGNTTLATGDMITAEFTGGSNGNEVLVLTNTTAVTNSVMRQYTPTTWSDISGEALKFIVNYTTSYPDVRKQHFWDYFSGSKLTTPAGANYSITQTTYNDVSGIGSFTGGWGSRFNAGHPLVGQEIRSITVRMKIQGSLNIVNMTARVYGSTNATLRATSTAVSSSGITTSFSSVTFTFPAGSRGIIQAGDHLMIVADSAVSSQGWNCQIKGSNPASGQHFTTWQGQSNAFTEQTYRDLWFSPIIAGAPAIPSRWTERSVTGSPTFGMNDSVDGGFVITTASTTNSSGMIDFNNKRQYSNTGSVCILTIQRIDDTMQVFGGFADNITQATTNTAWVLNDTNYSYYRLLTGNSSGATQTDTTTNIDKLLKVHKIECNSADVSLTIDGTLGINKTTNLPTNKLQPNFGGFTRNSSANQMRINYMECYNT